MVETGKLVDFDTLARQVKLPSEGTKKPLPQIEADINQLYQELFALNTWYFLHDPDDVQRPLIVESSNGASLLPAFTDDDRAERWAAQSGFYPPDSESPVILISVTQCLFWIWDGGLAAADKVSSLCFNLGSEEFMLPIEAIQEMTIEVLSDKHWRCKGGITPTFVGALKGADELNLNLATNAST